MQLLDLKPTQVRPHPRNPRTNVTDDTLAELADSIRALGILEPLIVAPTEVEGKYWLIAGHRRMAAAKATGVKTLPSLVRDDLDTPAKQLEAMLVENLQRTDLTPVEEGAAYQTLLEFPGYTMTSISKATGRNIRTIRSRVGIAKLPEATRKQIHTGQITIDQATELTKHATDPAALKRLTLAAGTDRWAWELQRVKENATAERRIAKTTKQLTADGIRVVDATTLPNGWRWGTATATVQTLIRLGIPAVATDTHAQCEGHAAVVDTQGDAVYICTTPTVHAPTASADEADDPEWVKEQAEDERLKDLLRTAATLRAEHLATVVSAGDATMAHELLLTATQDLIRRDFRRHKARIRALLGAGDKATADDVAAAVAGHTIAQLAILRDVLYHLDSDDTLADPYTWRDGSYTQAWRTRLGGVYGWEWTEGELEALRVNASRDAAADAAEQDEDDEDDEDDEEGADL